jgi:hypothetical protein
MRKFRLILLFFCSIQISFYFITEVKAQTMFDANSGVYGNMLNDLKKSLCENTRIKKVTLDGKDCK